MDKLIRNLLVLIALSLPTVLASTTPTTSTTSTTSTTPSSTPSVVPVDGGGVAAGGVGSVVGSSDPGADGTETGSISLSTGGIVGIAVGIAVVVIAIVAMWSLWFIAKRRQLTVRETLKRASRRLTGRKVPPTPRGGNKRQGTIYGVPKDIERGTASKSLPSEPAKHTPASGWLAEEKDRSRSRSPGSEKPTQKQGKKFGFGFK